MSHRSFIRARIYSKNRKVSTFQLRMNLLEKLSLVALHDHVRFDTRKRVGLDPSQRNSLCANKSSVPGDRHIALNTS